MRLGNDTGDFYDVEVTDEIDMPEGFQLVMTCMSCPEQYDMFYRGIQCAYFRLRGGRFTVTMPSVEGELVYMHHWEDDTYKGNFDTDDEREEHMSAAIREVVEYLRKGRR